MSLLHRYILRELVGPCLMAFTIFTLVLVTGNLVKLADLLVNKGVPPWDVLRLFGLLIPSLLSHTVPMAILTGTLLAFGRLSNDQEITAMQASGVSLWHLAAPVAAVGLVVSLGLVLVNDHLVPNSRFATRRVLEEIGIRNPAAYLEPGVFVKEFKPYVLFVYQMEGNHLSKVRIYEPMEGRPTRTILAERGEFIPMPDTKQVQFRLFQGTSDEPDLRNPARFYKLEFASYTMTLNLATGRDPSNLRKKPKDMTPWELRREIRELAAQGIDPTPLATEQHRRPATAAAALAFVLVGMPLAIRTRRAERSIGYALSLALILLYYLLSLGTQSLAVQGLVPPGPALWLPNALLVGAGLLLLQRVGHR